MSSKKPEPTVPHAGGPHGGGPKFAKPKDGKKTFLRLLSFFKPYLLILIVVAVCIIIAAEANVLGTAQLQTLIDDHITPMVKYGSTPELWAGFVKGVLKMLAIYLVGVVCMFVYARLMVNVSTGVLNDIRKQMFSKLQKLPIKYFDRHTHGEIMSLYTNDTDSMREMVSQSIPQILNSLVRVVSVLVMMIVLSPMLTLVALFMLAVIILAAKVVGKHSSAYFKKRQAALAKANGYIEEMTEGQKVVKVFCRERNVESEFGEINDNLRKAEAGANAWASALMPLMGNLGYIHYTITAIIGTLMVIAAVKGNTAAFLTLTAGELITFLQYTRNFAQPITTLSQQFNSILSALAGAERIFNMLDEKPEEDEGRVKLVNAKFSEDGSLIECPEHTGVWAWKKPAWCEAVQNEDGTMGSFEHPEELIRVRGDVRFKDVTFSYDGKKTVLDDINLYAEPGQKIAFVGSTGAGKTTITNLLNRFYDIQEGEITYDGIELTDICKDDLRRSLAMVLQDTHLFTGTVRDNIRYGKADATDEEIVEAAKLANAHFFISHLPKGYDTMIENDGENLSQGQRQLLAIARAAVADPPVIVLDEATSSIDTRTEALIEKGMDKLMQGRTVFVIAHRLSTVRNSDAIMVLENGRIIERGSHDDLIRFGGRYYRLYTGAFELS